MKLVFQPTLFDMRGMLGEQLYVDFIWMWRDSEHKALSQERRAIWAAKLSDRKTDDTGMLTVARPELRAAPPVLAPVMNDESPAAANTTAFPATRDNPARVGGRRKAIAVRF